MAKLRPDPKKSFSGGLILFFLLSLLTMIVVQTITSDRAATVSFSHQAEHLVNLNLTVPEENQKIAQNEHLVTFSGIFRDHLPEEAVDRYRYLELLDRQHQLQEEQQTALTNLDPLREKVVESADFYLHLSGLAIPRKGYVVVDSLYNTSGQDHAVVLKSLSDRETASLSSVEKAFEKGSAAEAGAELRSFISLLRSPALGIGSEPLKQQLRELDAQAASATSMATYKEILQRVTALVEALNQDQDGVRLTALRSVRNYVDELQQLTNTAQELDKNSILLDKTRQKVASTIWFFNGQELSTRALEKQDPDGYRHWFAQAQQEWDHFAANKGLAFRAPDQPRNTVLEKTFKSHEPSPNYFSYVMTFLPVLMVVFFLYFIFSKQMKGMGSSAINFGKSPARLMTKDTNKITFKDVAGADESKEELKEIVDFLKDPQRFTALGARIPKGVLLVGPPGTGKTLIAKAVAGEADRPFFSISGSDFVEMFVGVGASRIRDLFDQAKKNAPCIIFMDEIDAVGRHRGAGIGGGHDEREQTLNQLLVEMDGFDTKEGVILMAATNRPDVLDRALLRPGRFDRRVTLDLPDVKGRFDILKVHARRIKIDASVNLEDLARSTPGSSGADLENMLNEAALLAARRGRSAVTSSEAKEACDKVRFGKERRSLEMDETEKLTTAYHEAGHAITGLLVEHGDPVDKITIIPRGFSLGATHFMPKKNRLSYWKKEVLDRLIVLMGGRAAEELFVQDMSSGAQHDIVQATRFARSMVCEWGMTDLGTIAYDERSEGGQYLGNSSYQERTYSEETAREIDQKVKSFLDQALTGALEILRNHRKEVELMANMLMEFETLDRTDVDEIMAGTWDADRKRGRLKAAEDLQMRPTPPPAPPLPNNLGTTTIPSPAQ